MGSEELDRLVVERDAASLARLGALLDQSAARQGHAALHGDRAAIQVDVRPPQSDHLAAARAGQLGRVDAKLAVTDGAVEAALRIECSLRIVLLAKGRQVWPARGRPEHSSRHRCSRA
jgi:hypothetical protein